MKYWRIILQNIFDNTQKNTSETRPYFKQLGLIIVICYIGFYFINIRFSEFKLNESLSLRLIAAFLGMLLYLRKKWPKFLVHYENLLFHFTLLYIFPFFFSYMLFLNQNSNIWQINEMLGLILLSSFVDWISYITIVILGITSAYLFLSLIYPDFTFQLQLLEICFACSSLVIHSVIVSRKNRIIYQKKQFQFMHIKKLNLQLKQKLSERTFELQHALDAKNEFLNNMSHEIRSPVQGLLSISESLEENWQIISEPERFSLIQIIATSARRLVSLIGSLLDISKINSGEMLLNIEEYDLNILIKDVILECTTLYNKEKNIKFIFKPKSLSYFIEIDKERIAQVLRNIIFNAIKFSPENSLLSINISLSKIFHENNNIASKALHITIKDQGVGIPQNELETIFIPFTQSSRTKTKAGGTGLGLSISRSIIVNHHGKIWAANNKDGGASFHIILPITQNSAWGKQILKEEDSEFRHQQNYKIMLIDDDEVCLKGIEMILLNSPYDLICFGCGLEALKFLENPANKVDLILLDLMMPKIYGLNLLQQLRNIPHLKNIAVILQTGSSDEGEINKAYKMGIISHIKKPYQKQVVIDEIKKILN